MKTRSQVRYNRIPAFILLYGLCCGISLYLNFLLIPLIGYAAILTQLFVVFNIFFFFIRVYSRLIRTDLKIITSILIGLPVFLLGLAIFKYFSDLGTNIQYTDFGRRALLDDWINYSLLMTGILSFIFLPIHKWKNRESDQKIE